MNSAYLGNHLAVAKTLLGSKIFVSTKDQQVAPHILLDGEWEAWMTRAIHPYLRNAVFFDVGANYGWYCLVAKNAQARKIVAFEPNPDIFELLEATMKLNGISSDLYCAAVGETVDQMILNVNESCPGSSSIIDQDWAREWHSCEVMPLDDIAFKLFEKEPELLSAPVVLKADVEGFEAKVVMGAQKLLSRKTPSVTAFIEHHHDPENVFGFRDMLDFFEAQGFTLNLVSHDESIQRITREQLDSIPDAEMLCFRRFSA